MAETAKPNLSGVAETLLIPLYTRAMESQRPDAMIKDEKAVALVRQMSYDFGWFKQIPMGELERLTLILRSREFDRYAEAFMEHHPEAVVVHIGCGLDSRFERVDNGRVEWYDLDLPDVIELRRRFPGAEGPRHHLLGCSVLDNGWVETVRTQRQRPFLFIAEGVSMYLEGAQVRSLVLALREHFPGAELVLDAFSPFHIWRSNLQLVLAGLATRFPRLRWGLWRGQEVESWGPGIHLLDDWGYLDRPEARLAPLRWLRHIPLASRAGRIYHFILA